MFTSSLIDLFQILTDILPDSADYLVLLPLAILILAWSTAFFVGVVLPRRKLRNLKPVSSLALVMPEAAKDKLIKVLQKETNVSSRLAKRALEETAYEYEKAVQLLKVTSSKEDTKTLKHGRTFTYTHEDKVGVLLEVKCKTKEASNCVDMDIFLKDLAKQIAVTNPAYIKRGTVSNSRDPLSSAHLSQFEDSRLVLMEQVSINPTYKDKTVQQMVTELSLHLKEPVVISKVVRSEVSQS